MMIVLTFNVQFKVLTDRSKRGELLPLLLWIRRVNLFLQVCTLIFIKLSWIDFTSDKFDTFSNNFYQTSLSFNVLARQNDVNPQTRSKGFSLRCYRFKNLHGCSDCRFRFAISVPKDKYDVRKKAKRHGIFFFSNYLNYLISSAGSLHASKILTVGKILQLYTDHHARWPLCKLWEHRFSVPDLVSSLPPPRF